jgi:hypothetical protein
MADPRDQTLGEEDGAWPVEPARRIDQARVLDGDHGFWERGGHWLSRRAAIAASTAMRTATPIST